MAHFYTNPASDREEKVTKLYIHSEQSNTPACEGRQLRARCCNVLGEDQWDMWWKSYLVDFFSTVIRAFVINKVVDVNRVYVTGFSAGGDGIYHLGPMMADVWAGACMMSGHPNGA